MRGEVELPEGAMRIYWSWKDIPELADLPPAERRRIWRRCVWKTYRHWQTWAAFIIGGACPALGQLGARAVGLPAFDGFVGLMVIVIGGFIGGVVIGHAVASIARPYLREQIALEGGRVCMRCGYDLRGSLSGVCPECGEEEAGKGDMQEDVLQGRRGE